MECGKVICDKTYFLVQRMTCTSRYNDTVKGNRLDTSLEVRERKIGKKPIVNHTKHDDKMVDSEKVHYQPNEIGL